MTARLAVLVDGDNIGSSHAGEILTVAARFRRPDIVQTYANVQTANGWNDAAGYHLIHAGKGKNAADLLLSIDAMELALAEGVTTFVIASSDGDFTHLARRLRRRGAIVVGMGAEKSPQAYRASCSQFNQFASSKNSAPEKAPATQVLPPSDFDLKIRDMIKIHSKGGQGMQITDLSLQMRAEHDAKISTQPEKNWRNYLKARPHLYDLDPRGTAAKVRFKPKGFAAA